MAKGKKHVAKISEHKTPTSPTETKENQPVTDEEVGGNVPSILQTPQSPKKPRSPLGDAPRALSREGNDPNSTPPNKESTKEVECERCKAEQPADQREPKEGSEITPTASKAGRRTAPKAPSKKTDKGLTNRKVTDYYPIRRSNRKTRAELKDEEHKVIDELIQSGTEEGMEVRLLEGKGRGIFAIHGFRKGDFVVEYHGDLLELHEAKKRENQYSLNPQTGCYMYYFNYQQHTYCVDATKESGRLGRLINHSKSGNCHTRLHPTGGTPHLILVASRDIRAGEELLYDYGDRSMTSLQAHPWLKH